MYFFSYIFPSLYALKEKKKEKILSVHINNNSYLI